MRGRVQDRGCYKIVKRFSASFVSIDHRRGSETDVSSLRSLNIANFPRRPTPWASSGLCEIPLLRKVDHLPGHENSCF